MTNTLPFLPIELQNIIFSYARPVYPHIKELKKKEEERQKEIDDLLKLRKKIIIFDIRNLYRKYYNIENFFKKIKREKYINKIKDWGKSYFINYYVNDEIESIKTNPINYMKFNKRVRRFREIIEKYESLENRRCYDIRTYLYKLKEDLNKLKMI